MPRPFHLVRLLLLGVLALAWTWGVELKEDDLKEDGKVLLHYAIHAPPVAVSEAGRKTTKQTPRNLGLFLCFHEHIQDVRAEGLHVVEALERLQVSDDYVVIAPKASNPNQNYNEADRVGLPKLIAWAQATYPINPRRIFIWGRGAGAQFGGVYALKNPDTIAGVILFSWGFQWDKQGANPAHLPDIYYALGLKDLDTHVAKVRSTYGMLRDAGLKIIYREAAGFGGVTDHQPTNDEAITWAHQTRHKTKPLSSEEVAVLRPFTSVSAVSATKSEVSLTLLAEIGGPQAGSLLPPFFSAKSESVRLAAISTCTQALFGDEVVTAVGRLLTDKSLRIRQAAIEALSHNANFRSVPAQIALVRLALDTKADASDRGMAVDGLIHALTRQTEGAFQDVELFAALVTLLSDKNAGLRAKAWAFLQPLRPSSSSAEAGGAALADWKAWIAGLTGKTGVGKHTGSQQQR